MGCSSSIDAQAPAEAIRNTIDEELERGEREEEGTVKVLLLGPGKSGKSTIMKQARILYGSPRTDEELQMFGVVVRSNCLAVARKLCRLIRTLRAESDLEREGPAEGSDQTPSEALGTLLSHLVHGTAPPIEPTTDLAEDWVGHCAAAGLGPRNDAQLFLQLWKPIRALWQVSLVAISKLGMYII